MTPLADGLLLAATVLVVGAAAFGARAVLGPTLQDRVVAVNAVGTTIVMVIALAAAALDEPGFLDVALVYALLNFLLSIGLGRVLADRGRSA